ncbi:lasso RiPP family leader peptide-containing protein [Methanobacterium sp.]
MTKEKVTYEKPELSIYGNVNEITKGGGTIPGEPHGDS